MARRLRLPEVRAWRRMGRRRWPAQVRGLRQAHVGDGGHAVRPQADAADVWFTACGMFATAKDGVSALGLQRSLEIGSYPTAWAMLHRLRSVLVRPGRYRLTGTVEADETFIGGEEAGLRGGGAKGKKSLVGVAVEVRQPRGMAAAGWRSCPTPRPIAAPLPDPPRRAGRDGDHRRLDGLPRDHRARLRPCPAQPASRPRPREYPGKLLPGVHRVASLAKRWLPGTHQGSVEDTHLQSYLNEFCFRFNRRLSPPGLALVPRARARRQPRSGAIPGPGR